MITAQRSMRYRFSFIMGIILVISLTILWIITGMATRMLTEEYITERVEHEIDSLLTELNLDDHDYIKLDEGHTDVVFHHAFSGHYFQIRLLNEVGQVTQSQRSRSLGEMDLAPLDIQVVRESRFKVTGPQGTHLLGVTRTLPLREQRLVISVAEEVDLYEQHFRWFQVIFALFCLTLFIGVFGALVFLLKREFRPFKRLEKQLTLLSSGEIRRLDTEVPNEIQPLIHQFNWMLETAEQRVKRTRIALDNLAHSLKRPLTILMQTADDPELASLDEQRTLLTNNSRLMHGIIERTLRRARLVDISLPGQQFVISHEVPILIHTVKSLYYQKKLEIDLDLKVDTICLCDREEMLELLGNLLDNACKWTKMKILLTIEADDEEIRCIVEDDGPGCSEELIHSLTERGRRLDEEVEGHGLGLAIAKEIIDQLGGHLELGRSNQLGGFLARCHLPKVWDQMGMHPPSPK
ncbi:MAG: HAMP domain-containing histidine kinase [Magnetococcales bacterium]|nr:HAMP domain-containing histidine kinase [Magnetococcales bacterium]